MKVIWNTCDKELSYKKLVEKLFLNLPKVTTFQTNLCKIFSEKQYIGIVYGYVT